MTLMLAMAPRRLCSRVLRKPLVTAMATTRAMTPAATPSTEMAVMMEMADCLRWAGRERAAKKHSKEGGIRRTAPSRSLLGRLRLGFQLAEEADQIDGAFRAQQREEDDVAYGARARKDH